MVIFGPAPTVAAHAEAGNPLAARRDKAVEAGRAPVPPVPRAPRPAPKAQSAGSLARDTWSRQPRASSASRPSEQRRPREESPFTTACEYRRVNALARETEAAENQRMEMGPERRPASDGPRDYRRGHALGQDSVGNAGMPWQTPPEDSQKGEQQNVGRRHVLRHERQAADQTLEWVPAASASDMPVGPAAGQYFRVNALAREQKAEAEMGEFLPGAARNAPLVSGASYHGRRNVLARETAVSESVEMPRATGTDAEGAPRFARENRLIRENPVGHTGRGGGAKEVAARG